VRTSTEPGKRVLKIIRRRGTRDTRGGGGGVGRSFQGTGGGKERKAFGKKRALGAITKRASMACIQPGQRKGKRDDFWG